MSINEPLKPTPGCSVMFHKPGCKKSAEGFWNVTYNFTVYPLLWAISLGDELPDIPFVQASTVDV